MNINKLNKPEFGFEIRNEIETNEGKPNQTKHSVHETSMS